MAKANPMATTFKTETMADPYDPEPGRRAQRAYREKVGKALTDAILQDPDNAARTRAALRHIDEGDLRPRLDDT